MDLNLVVGKTNHVLPNLIPTTLNTCIINSIEDYSALTSPVLNHLIYNNTAYNALSPNAITTNSYSYTA